MPSASYPDKTVGETHSLRSFPRELKLKFLCKQSGDGRLSATHGAHDGNIEMDFTIEVVPYVLRK